MVANTGPKPITVRSTEYNLAFFVPWHFANLLIHRSNHWIKCKLDALQHTIVKIRPL